MDAIIQEYRNRAERLKDGVRYWWRRACEHDGIDPDTDAIVAWSDENPHAAEYDAAMSRYLQYRRDHNV